MEPEGTGRLSVPDARPLAELLVELRAAAMSLHRKECPRCEKACKQIFAVLERLDAARVAPEGGEPERWSLREVDSGYEVERVYDGMETDAAGEWVRWDDVKGRLAPPVPLPAEPSASATELLAAYLCEHGERGDVTLAELQRAGEFPCVACKRRAAAYAAERHRLDHMGLTLEEAMSFGPKEGTMPLAPDAAAIEAALTFAKRHLDNEMLFDAADAGLAGLVEKAEETEEERRHWQHMTEVSNRAAEAIKAGDKWPPTHWPSPVERAWYIVAQERITALRKALSHAASSLDHLMAFKGSRLEETQRAGHELNITRARAALAATAPKETP